MTFFSILFGLIFLSDFVLIFSFSLECPTKWLNSTCSKCSVVNNELDLDCSHAKNLRGLIWALRDANLQILKLQVHDSPHLFKNLPGKIFDRLKIKQLDLSHNNITGISPRAFFGLEDSLVSLNLAENNLQSVPDLSKLKKLESIDLRKNSFSKNPFEMAGLLFDETNNPIKLIPQSRSAPAVHPFQAPVIISESGQAKLDRLAKDALDDLVQTTTHATRSAAANATAAESSDFLRMGSPIMSALTIMLAELARALPLIFLRFFGTPAAAAPPQLGAAPPTLLDQDVLNELAQSDVLHFSAMKNPESLSKFDQSDIKLNPDKNILPTLAPLVTMITEKAKSEASPPTPTSTPSSLLSTLSSTTKSTTTLITTLAPEESTKSLTEFSPTTTIATSITTVLTKLIEVSPMMSDKSEFGRFLDLFNFSTIHESTTTETNVPNVPKTNNVLESSDLDKKSIPENSNQSKTDSFSWFTFIATLVVISMVTSIIIICFCWILRKKIWKRRKCDQENAGADAFPCGLSTIYFQDDESVKNITRDANFVMADQILRNQQNNLDHT